MTKLLEFQLQHQPLQQVFRVDFPKIDWFDLLDVQRILRRLLQHHSSNASVIQSSAVFMVLLSQPYMTPGKTMALTMQIFVSRVMSLLFNALSLISLQSKEFSSLLQHHISKDQFFCAQLSLWFNFQHAYSHIHSYSQNP